jgi:hypothetical protein
MCGRQTVSLASRASLAALLFATLVMGTLAGNVSVAQASTGPRVLPVGKKYPAAVERYRSAVKRYFPKDRKGQVPRRLQQEALAIIMWESGGSPASGPCEGIWQFSRDHGSHAQRLNPVTATRMAARMYIAQGRRWRPGWAAAGRLGLR